LGHLFIIAFRWFSNHLLSFVVILVLLAGGKWCYSQFEVAKSERAAMTAVLAARPEIGQALLSASKQLDKQIQQIARGGHGGGKVRQELDRLIEQKTAERNAITSRSPFDGIPTVSDFQRLAVLDMEIAALKKASDNAKQLELLFSGLAEGRAEWANHYQKHATIRSEWAKHELAIESIRANNQIASRIPRTSSYSEIEQLIDLQIDLTKKADDLKKAIEAVKLKVEVSERVLDAAARTFGIGNSDIEGALKRSDEKLESEIKRRSNSFFWAASESFWPAIHDQMPVALAILLTAILVPVGIKLLFFFVIAPWAARQQPIQILPLAASANSSSSLLAPEYVQSGKPSAVSLAIEIAPDEELLVHPDYIQSSSANAGKTTKWLLDWGFPFTSLAAGLYALTRIAPRQTETVVVSSTNDPLMEVAVIEIPGTSALVVQPRALVGVVQTRASGVKITSHWRINHLHSWLTLQFRYLAFHGPGRLIIKGCRGVRVEPAIGGRLVNQAATLGFSANALYSVHRCETFVAYWRGIEELFNDQFSGADSIYLYEEMPDLHRKGGITGRGLQGLTDSALKVFGV
jgi:hypothetical protein